MKYFKTIKMMAVAGMMCMPLLAQAQLLKGKFVGVETDDVVVGYSPDGNMMNMQYNDLKVADDGTFTFDMEMSDAVADVCIYVGEKGTLGAQLVKGKTVEMNVTAKGDELEATFKGPNAAVCRLVNQKAMAFDMSKYFAMDPSNRKTNAEYRALLEEENAKVKALLPKIKDKNQREYYTKLADAEYRWMKMRIIADDCDEKKLDRNENAEVQALLKDIDINDDINYQTNFSLWKLISMPKAKMEGNCEAYCYELMDYTNKLVTNPNVRKQMVRIIGQNYYTYGDGSGDYETFTKRFKEFAGEDAAMVDQMYAQFMEVKKSREKTAAGTPAPDITLDLPDGSQVQLKDIAKGKFTYIDVWATWCGPCKREIPHMAKLVEKFKGNDKVNFISISVDEDVNAWKKMIDADKPAWPQYNINGETNRKFSADWGITGIPRFIMIDKNGNIFAADASRPSNEETANIIEEQTRK
ncbi:MAG: TlpA family protein disulfide reductase [Prevotella sp.]|nr:TlpA family protein disulfide reductase [Prevotella sp.]MBR1462278.1 TlpA family protein disulfide reductase [Prevotella sp.]